MAKIVPDLNRSTNSGIAKIRPDTKLFGDLVGEGILDFVFEASPHKVGTRIGKALDHFDKAIRLKGIDEEMGALRLIAAEEELVVAIFEWLKLSADKMPEHDDFIKKYKNHRMKLSFYPVLSQFRFVLGDMLTEGMTLDGLEHHIHWTIKPVLHENKILLQIIDADGKELIKHNPLATAISKDELSHDQIVDELFKDFSEIVHDQLKMSVREFVTARAEYRNKLLYAERAGPANLDRTISGVSA